MPLHADRILIRGTNWIGDLVMISPALEAVRNAWPDAHIAFLVRDHLADACLPNPSIDEVIPYEKQGRHAPPLGSLSLARELKERRFDLALLFTKAFEAALLAWLAGIPNRVGWATDRRGLLLTHSKRLTAAERKRHHVDQFLEVARLAGCPLPESRTVSFPVSDTDRRSASSLLNGSLQEKGLLLAIHPGASKAPRSWHPERFGETANLILDARPGSVLLLGGSGDRAACSRIRGALAHPSINLAGKTSIGQMAALIETSDLVLCNDSGPMHLSAALGTPHVAIFGPGIPALTAPIGDSSAARNISLGLPCAPCRQNFFKECRPGPAGKPYCLEDLSVASVVDAALALLNQDA